MEIPISPYKYRRIAADFMDLLEEGGQNVLASFGEKAKSEAITYESILSHGDPARQILAFAKKENCD